MDSLNDGCSLAREIRRSARTTRLDDPRATRRLGSVDLIAFPVRAGSLL
jgi:hypothetical protein